MTNSNKRGPLPKGRSGPIKRIVPAAAEPKLQPGKSHDEMNHDELIAAGFVQVGPLDYLRTAEAAQAAEAQVPEAQVPEAPEAAQAVPPAAPAAADKAALMAELMAELGEAIDRPDGDSGPHRKGAEAIRCHWSPEVTEAAAGAAVRLPGLFPARGDGPKTAEKIGCSAAYVWRPQKGGAVIPTRKGDVALQGIFRASKRISNGETLTLDWLLTCVEATRKFCILKEATQPDWLDNLVVTEGMKKNEGVGLQTSLLYQLAKQSGRTVAITSDETVMAV